MNKASLVTTNRSTFKQSKIEISMTDNLQKPQCPISKLKRKSQSILKKEKQSKINRKSLETKLKKEESITNIGINKIRLLINRTKIDDENILFGYYCSSELLVDL